MFLASCVSVIVGVVSVASVADTRYGSVAPSFFAALARCAGDISTSPIYRISAAPKTDALNIGRHNRYKILLTRAEVAAHLLLMLLTPAMIRQRLHRLFSLRSPDMPAICRPRGYIGCRLRRKPMLLVSAKTDA